MGGFSRLKVEVVKVPRTGVDPAFLRKVVGEAARLPEIQARLPAGESMIAVRLTDDAELRDLNRRFAGEDRTTDVLSFSGEGGHVGDIAISWPATKRQAASHGHAPEVELALLAVHGLLHVLGWDHASTSARKEMWRVTDAALARSSIKLAPDRRRTKSG